MASMMGGMGGKGGGKGAAPEDDAEKSGGEGKWHWNQKGDEIQVRIPLSSAATKKDISVKFNATSLFVSAFGNTIIDGALGGKVETDDCTWCLSSDKTELQVMLTKVEGKSEAWSDLMQ